MEKRTIYINDSEERRKRLMTRIFLKDESEALIACEPNPCECIALTTRPASRRGWGGRGTFETYATNRVIQLTERPLIWRTERSAIWSCYILLSWALPTTARLGSPWKTTDRAVRDFVKVEGGHYRWQYCWDDEGAEGLMGGRFHSQSENHLSRLAQLRSEAMSERVWGRSAANKFR